MILMRCCVISTFCFFLAGCTAPGTYMSKSDVRSSTSSDLQGRLMSATVIPIDSNLLYSGSKVISKPQDPYQYHVGPYDILDIIVWNHPELSLFSGMNNESASFFATDLNTQTKSLTSTSPQTNGINVDADGYIFFPLIGKIKVSGLTPEQIRSQLTTKLLRYIRNPEVSVNVSKYNSQLVNIMGEVVQPGIRPLTNRPISILDGLNLVGGIRPDSGDASHIYLFRGNINNIAIYKLNAKSPQALMMAQNFRLAANDIIYVPPAGIVSWNRVISLILPTVQTVWMTDRMIND